MCEAVPPVAAVAAVAMALLLVTVETEVATRVLAAGKDAMPASPDASTTGPAVHLSDVVWGVVADIAGEVITVGGAADMELTRLAAVVAPLAPTSDGAV